jgi:hypothetical protein
MVMRMILNTRAKRGITDGTTTRNGVASLPETASARSGRCRLAVLWAAVMIGRAYLHHPRTKDRDRNLIEIRAVSFHECMFCLFNRGMGCRRCARADARGKSALWAALSPFNFK